MTLSKTYEQAPEGQQYYILEQFILVKLTAQFIPPDTKLDFYVCTSKATTIT